jgi:membrane protein
VNVAELWRHARTFVREELWEAQFEPRSWPDRGLRVLQFAAMVAQGFVRDRLLLRASALTYFAVLSVVPMIAIAISIGSAVGITANIAGPLVEQFAAGNPEAQKWILGFIENANFAGLGTVGAAILFLTTVLGISNIERALNHVWGVQQDRPWARRLPDYLAVLVVAPMLLGVGLSLGTTLKSQWLVQRLVEYPLFATAYELGLSQAPAVVLALAFGFLYWFLPNTQVRPFAALLGGAVASVLVGLAQTAYLNLNIGVGRASAFFGLVAWVPLLFLWIYVFWAIVLFGAEFAFAYQNLDNYRREVRGRRAGPAGREAIGVRIAVEVARRFRDGGPAWTADTLADVMHAPVRTVRDVLAHLERAGVVVALEPSAREGGMQLGRPAERILVTDVLWALRGSREPAHGDSQVAEGVERLLAELDEGTAKGAAGQTLGDVLDRIALAGRAGDSLDPPERGR